MHCYPDAQLAGVGLVGVVFQKDYCQVAEQLAVAWQVLVSEELARVKLDAQPLQLCVHWPVESSSALPIQGRSPREVLSQPQG